MERLIRLLLALQELGGWSGLIWASDSSSPTTGAELTQALGAAHWEPRRRMARGPPPACLIARRPATRSG